MESDEAKIVKSNLDRLEEIQNAVLEKRIAHLSECARVLVDEAGDDEIFFRDEAFAARYRAMTESGETSVAPVQPQSRQGEKSRPVRL